jgi:hypothetical protein
MLDLTGFIFAGEVPPGKMYELLTTKWGVGRNLAATLIDYYGGHVYDILLKLEELNSMGDSFLPGSQMQADSVLECLKFDGDKAHMRELLTQIAENGFAPLKDKKDREAEVISKYNVGGLVQFERATIIGLPLSVRGEHEMGLIPSKQSIRLVIAKVLEKNPFLEDDARVVSTGVVSGLKSPSPKTDEETSGVEKEISRVEEEISRVEIKIEKVEAVIEKSTDPEDKKLLRKKEEQLRKKEEQLRKEKELLRKKEEQLRKEKELLREERLILRRRQDSSNE